MTPTGYAHIDLRSGIAYVTGTTTRVDEVVIEWIAWGWDAQKIHEEHPYLTLGQIHSAFAYYFDHKEELDAQMEAREREVEEILSAIDQSAQSALIERIRAKAAA